MSEGGVRLGSVSLLKNEVCVGVGQEGGVFPIHEPEEQMEGSLLSNLIVYTSGLGDMC